ncbi:unnamed protein product [Urochloa humidicola]
MRVFPQRPAQGAAPRWMAATNKAQMQITSGEDEGAGRAPTSVGRAAPSRSTARMATKRKLDAIDPIPSPGE